MIKMSPKIFLCYVSIYFDFMNFKPPITYFELQGEAYPFFHFEKYHFY